jgi:hypothetical protein
MKFITAYRLAIKRENKGGVSIVPANEQSYLWLLGEHFPPLDGLEVVVGSSHPLFCPLGYFTHIAVFS